VTKRKKEKKEKRKSPLFIYQVTFIYIALYTIQINSKQLKQ